MEWYQVFSVDTIDSPALLVYKDRMQRNIEHAIRIAGSVDRLRPHVKTHKIPQIIQLHVSLGIDKFKCATIAEAEMIAQNGGKDILLAHQPTGPKVNKLFELVTQYPEANFSTIVDHPVSLKQIQTQCMQRQVSIAIWLDVDNGMHRSGIGLGEEALTLCRHINEHAYTRLRGLHVYDGHIRDQDLTTRKQRSDQGFEQVYAFLGQLQSLGMAELTLVAGGTPTFPIHAQREGVELSPGTYIFWDFGYGDLLPDLPFEPAALVLTRVISKPAGNRVCVDLGHKSIAAEKPHPRVRFFDIEIAQFITHSEEHLVFEAADANRLNIGSELYGIPVHICPTVALHQQVYVIEDHQLTDQWQVLARNRIITI